MTNDDAGAGAADTGAPERMGADSVIAVLDWRRRVRDMYETVVATKDPAAAHAVWRMHRDVLFGKHPASPLSTGSRDRFTGLEVPEYDPAWRFEASIEPAEPAHLDVPTGTDGVVPFDRIGTVALGDLGRLDVWWLGSYGGGVFIPVKDDSAGRPGGTYGGGRYLIDTVKGADLGGFADRLVLDLNFAYNPSCAYDEAWACPLAPPGNTLRVAVPVGERTFTP